MVCDVANCANGFIDDRGTACPTCKGTGHVPPIYIRWRLNDPGEGRERWTRVHLLIGAVPEGAPDRTLCGRTVPEHPYMADRDEDIPSAAPLCRTCDADPSRRR